MTSSKENTRKPKTGSRIFKERMPVCSIQDKYIDALIEINSPSICLDLALLTLITRFEGVPPLSEFSKIFHLEEIEIECSLRNLAQIGFLIIS